jgi:hypothetical protein
MFVLPQPKQKPIYYHALITEVCKLSASTVGPAVGKSIRKLYAMLGEGLDVEIARRFSDWFAVHMSNFAYQWVWKEWYNCPFFHWYTMLNLYRSGFRICSWIYLIQKELS